MMNLKFMDFEFGANLHNGVFFGLLHWKMKKACLIKPLVVGTEKAKTHDTPPKSMTTE